MRKGWHFQPGILPAARASLRASHTLPRSQLSADVRLTPLIDRLTAPEYRLQPLRPREPW
jgi:hypothetical protein